MTIKDEKLGYVDDLVFRPDEQEIIENITNDWVLLPDDDTDDHGLVNKESIVSIKPIFTPQEISPLVIKIKYLNDDIKRLSKIEVGDWIDLSAAEDTIIFKNQKALVNLGIAMKLPKGCEAYLLPRSSTANKYGCILLNSMGIIDESYCGNNDIWKANLYCLMPNQDGIMTTESDPKWFIALSKSKFGLWVLRHFHKEMYEAHKYTLIKAGDRICQFRIMNHMADISFEEVDILEDTDRGGFGTTS